MRLFVGVPIDAPAMAAVNEWVSTQSIPGRVVPPENWHFTLRFLGEVDDVGRDRLLAQLDGYDLGPPFAVRFSRLGGFPRAAKATVAFIDIDGGETEIVQLAERVEDACDAAGFEREERPFRPHLTISRIRPPARLPTSVDMPAAVPMTVDAVAVYRSHLGRGGARYEIIERFALD